MSDEKKTLKQFPVLLSDEEAEMFTDEADLSEYDFSGFERVRFELRKARVIDHDTLKADMQAVARGEKPAPTDAGQASFNSEEALKAAAEKGFASGVSDRSLDEILDDARARAQKTRDSHGRDDPTRS